MRYFFFLFCLFSLNCFGQNPEDFKKLGESPSALSSTLPKDVKLKIVKGLDHFIIKEIYSQDEMNVEKDLGNFAFIDYDEDHDLDIIYYGALREGRLGTVFFMNKDNTYSAEFMAFGEVSELKLDEQYQQLYFKLIEPPSSSDLVEGMSLYQVDFSKAERAFISGNRYHYVTGMGKVTNFIAPIKFKISNPQNKLRYSTVIDDTPLDPSMESSLPGNVIAAYAAGASGTAIATKTDKAGNVWWFVIMDANAEPTATILNDMGTKSKFYRCGWMSQVK